MGLAALEADEAEGVETRSRRSRISSAARWPRASILKPWPESSDRVGVRERPVADRVVVGRVGDDPAGEGRPPLLGAAPESPEGRRQAGGEELGEGRLGRVGRVVRPVGVEVGFGEQDRQAAAGDRRSPCAPCGSRSPRARARAPGRRGRSAGAPAGRGGPPAPRSPARPAEADAGERELSLLRLPVLDQRRRSRVRFRRAPRPRPPARASPRAARPMGPAPTTRVSQRQATL